MCVRSCCQPHSRYIHVYNLPSVYTIQTTLTMCSAFDMALCVHSSLVILVITPIPRIARILVLEKKNALNENRVSGTVVMIQLTQNSPTC